MIFMLSTGALTLLALLGLVDSSKPESSMKSRSKYWKMDPSSFGKDA